MDLQDLYREHYRSLVRFLYRRIGDPARAEDLAQEAFVRAIEHRPDKPRPWLFAVAANLARDEGRRTTMRRQHLKLIKTQPRASEPGQQVALERRETVRRVRRALSRLDERDREALLLREEGLSYDEIAAVLELARGSIGTTLSRARRRLASAFESLEAEGRNRDVAP